MRFCLYSYFSSQQQQQDWIKSLSCFLYCTHSFLDSSWNPSDPIFSALTISLIFLYSLPHATAAECDALSLMKNSSEGKSCVCVTREPSVGYTALSKNTSSERWWWWIKLIVKLSTDVGVRKSMKLLKGLISHRYLGSKFYSYQDVMGAKNLYGVKEILVRLMEEKSVEGY